jgi:hypothetical protein
MTRTVLETVKTPLIMFVEHDAMLRKDPPINWQASADLILSGQANVVRLYNWPEIWHEHAYLMHGAIEFEGVHFTRTTQYSQWPLLSSTEYHRKILDKYHLSLRRVMIETMVYGHVACQPWEKNKIVIYGPDGSKTFTHRDGRTDEKTGVRDPGEW